jgi:hypothetical protein
MANPTRYGMWAEIDSYWSCIFPVGFEPDPAIVNAIRSEFQPNYVPVFHRKVFRTPANGIRYFDYHVLGLWYPTIQEEVPDDPEQRVGGYVPLKLLNRGPWCPFHGGYVYAQRTFHYPLDLKSKEHLDGLPPIPIDYGWDIYHWMKAAHWDRTHDNSETEKQQKARLEAADQADRDAEQRELDRVNENARLKLYDDRYMIRRAIEQKKFDDPPVSPPASVAVKGYSPEAAA